MKLTLSCPECDTPLGVDESLLGKKVRCTSCKGVFVAEDPSSRAIQEQPPRETIARPSSRNGDDYAERPSRRSSRDDYDDEDNDDDRSRRRSRDDDDRPRRRRRRRSSGGTPHRAGSVLTLGIVSCCTFCIPLIGFICGVSAVNMANKDLAEMDAGRMDSSGERTTSTGRIFGYVGITLSAIMFVVGVIARVAAIGGR